MGRLLNQVMLGAAIAFVALGSPATAATSEVPAAPTFTKDIAPIFQAKCEACHRADSMAPMSLKTFAEVRPWVRSIHVRVADRQMPPWQIERSVGIQKFKNDRSLTDEERLTVLKWIDDGAPAGRPEGHAAARELARGSGVELRRAVRSEGA